jgi:hypothetical protein
MRMSKTLCARLPLPEAVACYFVKRFPDLLEALVTNRDTPDAAYADTEAAKRPVEVSAQLLSRDNPAVISAWCHSSDKRERTVNLVLEHWVLPPPDQLALAKKALSSDAADRILRAREFSAAAKLTASRRAGFGAIWAWLASNPDITDGEWLSVLQGRLVESSYAGVAPYAALHQRPHLAPALLESEVDHLVAVACAFVDDIDARIALERVTELTTASARRTGLSNLADHPALPAQVRAEVYERAEKINLVGTLNQLGCPTVGSLMASPTPLAEIEDPRLVELVALRATGDLHGRAFQLIELTKSKAASAALAHRIQSIPADHLGGSYAAAQALQDFARRLSETGSMIATPPYSVWWVFGNIAEQADSAANLRAEIETLESPRRSSAPRYYSPYYGSSNPITAEQVLSLDLSSALAKLHGYGADRNFVKVLGDALVEVLGSGDDDESLRRWENFIMLTDRSANTLTFGRIASSAARLS